MDLFVSPDNEGAAGALINHAIGFFNGKEGMDLIRCNILDDKIASMLRRFGFVRLKSSTRLMVSNFSLDDYSLQDISDRKNWFVSFFDSDLDLY